MMPDYPATELSLQLGPLIQLDADVNVIRKKQNGFGKLGYRHTPLDRLAAPWNLEVVTWGAFAAQCVISSWGCIYGEKKTCRLKKI